MPSSLLTGIFLAWLTTGNAQVDSPFWDRSCLYLCESSLQRDNYVLKSRLPTQDILQNKNTMKLGKLVVKNDNTILGRKLSVFAHPKTFENVYSGGDSGKMVYPTKK